MRLYYCLLLIILLYGCAPLQKTVISASFKPLGDSAEVAVVEVEQPMPDSVKLLGTLRYQGSSGNLTHKQLISAAKKEARTMGGNLIKVTDMALEGSCPLYISVFYRPNIKSLDSRLKIISDSIHRAKFGDNPKFAILYVYRPSGPGVIVGYKIRVNDSVIGKSRDNAFFQIKLHHEGPAVLEAHTEVSDLAKINVKFGEEYYLKCGIKMGLVIGEPTISIIPSWKGRLEYQEMERIQKNQTIVKDDDD